MPLYTHKVVHVETGVTVGRFVSEDAAKEWIEQLGVNRDYKERCYRIREVCDVSPIRKETVYATTNGRILR